MVRVQLYIPEDECFRIGPNPINQVISYWHSFWSAFTCFVPKSSDFVLAQLLVRFQLYCSKDETNKSSDFVLAHFLVRGQLYCTEDECNKSNDLVLVQLIAPKTNEIYQVF